MQLFVRGRILPEASNPINRALIWLYRPVIAGVLRARMATILIALLVLAATIIPLKRLGSEFMPTLNEGTLMYMPVSVPGMSVTKAAELLQTQDRIIKGFPEVASVFGKAGRAATATDPAPFEMFESIINLKPESERRPGVTIDSVTAGRPAPRSGTDCAKLASSAGGGAGGSARASEEGAPDPGPADVPHRKCSARQLPLLLHARP